MKSKRSIRRLKFRSGLIAAAVLLKLIDLGLRLSGYRRVCRWLLRLSPAPDPTRVDYPHAFAVARIINTAAHHPQVRATCLPRTLLAWWVLRWVGIPSDIRIGVNHDGGHAWIEHNGQVVNDRLNIIDDYTVTYSDELAPERIIQLI